jgi:ribonuclease D
LPKPWLPPRRKPRHRAELADVRGFSSKQIRRIGDEVLAAIARGLQKEPMRRLPQLPSKDGTGNLSEEEVELHERLKQWRKGVAAQMGIDSAYLVNRHVLLRIAGKRPRTPEALTEIDWIEPWQIEQFGAAILGVVEAFEDDLAAGRIQFRRRFKGNRAD